MNLLQYRTLFLRSVIIELLISCAKEGSWNGLGSDFYAQK